MKIHVSITVMDVLGVALEVVRRIVRLNVVPVVVGSVQGHRQTLGKDVKIHALLDVMQDVQSVVSVAAHTIQNEGYGYGSNK